MIETTSRPQTLLLILFLCFCSIAILLVLATSFLWSILTGRLKTKL